MNNYVTVDHENLKCFAKDIFSRVGLESQEAELVASHLVAANLRGVDSHGISRVPIYSERILSQLVNVSTNIDVIAETGSSALIDGKNSQGILVAQTAIEMAVDKAKSSGLALVGVNHSNHCGMLAYYSKYAVDHDCIAIITSNASPSMAPWGGRERFFGTNPLCYGIPAGSEIDIIFDMATSIVARGKIRLAEKNQQSIPLDWAITKDGRRTSDPLEALEGMVLPFGGPKGYGLVTLIDVLSGIMTGANFGPHVGSIVESQEQGLGHFFLVLKPDVFKPLDEFKSQMDQMIRQIKKVKKMEGVERIYLPGEIELELEEKRRKNGIPITEHVYEELIKTGNQLNVKLDKYMN